MREQAGIQPTDHSERRRALDPARSFLVQAPAGSGKTFLLTQRFLRLLAEAKKPDEIVAITFTNAAAAEMRSRILSELEKAEDESNIDEDPESLAALARRALNRSNLLGWQLLDQPGQLRILTVDAFCRSLALQSPLSWGLLSGLGGRLEPVSNPKELYRRAARRTLGVLEGAVSPERGAVEDVLLWRDNNWKDVEDLISDMLKVRNRWFQEFVFARENDWEALRRRLEAPIRRAARQRLNNLCRMLDRLEGCREFALELARAACVVTGKLSPLALAERAELPADLAAACAEVEDLEDAVAAYRDLARFLLTSGGTWRKKGGLNVNHGYPATHLGRAGKDRFGEFVDGLCQEPGLEAALAAFLDPMPTGYSEDDWTLLQNCFTVLRAAAVELQLVFAEAGHVDFTEVAQIALRILEEDGLPSDFALAQADGIRHFLIDEFQDTSRSQHQLLSRLISAWPEREGRSCFCVGDPMQSIYGFREAEVELFERAKVAGLKIGSPGLDSAPFLFETVRLRANFRTVPSLVGDLNGHFEEIFAVDDDGLVRFSPVEAARVSASIAKTELHLAFAAPKGDLSSPASCQPDQTRQFQLDEIVSLIRSKLESMAAMKAGGAEKFRIAVLGRFRPVLLPVAEALRQAGIGFRAIELVPLRERSEIVDALSLARALLNPVDRTAWLGVLRAPWCGLSLAELHLLTSAEDSIVSATPIAQLLQTRLQTLHEEGQFGSRAYAAASRVGQVLNSAMEARASSAGTQLGTWLESVWKALGGDDTVNHEQRENLRLLWAVLDKLPAGELDLLGPALDAALEELFALPDPEASSDFGVQLMTIHKAKGLEFEVVIVPDLEAKGRAYTPEMMSWLERGLADSSDEDDALTEFLIAPIQAKGRDSGDAKRWVDRVKREREAQELRRLLYVAATRAREELHLFARPGFRMAQKTGVPELAKATGLLATAWPAFGEEIESRFAEWVEKLNQSPAQPPASIESLAASATGPAGNLLFMPSGESAPRPTMLKRLPEDYASPGLPSWSAPARDRGALPLDFDGNHNPEPQPTGFARTEGGLRSRVVGTAFHALIEHISRQELPASEFGDLKTRLQEALPGVVAAIRGRGFPLREAEALAAEALEMATRTVQDPVGQWILGILAPHDHAETESRWTGFVRTTPQTGKEREQQRNLRPDRVFFATAGDLSILDSIGDPPPEGPVWWIVDYKTSDAAGANLDDPVTRQNFLNLHRTQHSNQLAAYAQVLRNLRSDAGIRQESVETLPVYAGNYYPDLELFDFWKV